MANKRKNGKNGSNIKRASRVKTSSLFPVRRLPRKVQVASELWLEIFLSNIDTLLATHEHVSEEQIVSTAETIANLALDRFQFRWPNAEL